MSSNNTNKISGYPVRPPRRKRSARKLALPAVPVRESKKKRSTQTGQKKSKKKRLLIVAREYCKDEKYKKNPHQRKLESLIFSSGLVTNVLDTTKRGDYTILNNVQVFTKSRPHDSYNLSFKKILGEGAYGIVYLLTNESMGQIAEITVKTMSENDEYQISKDLMKSNCDILRVKMIEPEVSIESSTKSSIISSIKMSPKTKISSKSLTKSLKKSSIRMSPENSPENSPINYSLNGYSAFMEPASGSLYDYKKKLSNEQILDIGNQILEQLRCLYNLKSTDRYVYTDLKSKNVLYYDCGDKENSKKLKVQLGDLGSAVSRFISKNNYEVISSYPAFEHRDGVGVYEIDINNKEVVNQVLCYQLGILLFQLKQPSASKYFFYTNLSVDTDSNEVFNLFRQLEEIHVGLSYLINPIKEKRPDILTGGTLEKITEKLDPDLYI